MLDKLLKHEFKSQYKLYLGMWAAILLFATMSCLSGILADNLHNFVFNTISSISTVFTVISLFAMFIITLIFSIYRYYNNLIRDEGYLMHTLPVKAFNLHLAKLLVPTVYFIFDAVILILSVSIMTRDLSFSWIRYACDLFKYAGFPLNAWNFIIFAVMMLISVLSYLSLFYACLNAGSLSTNNKGVMAFVAYIIFYIFNQILSLTVLLISILILVNKNTNGDWKAFFELTTLPDGYFMTMLIAGSALGIIYIIIYNVISGYIITKKVNLE